MEKNKNSKITIQTQQPKIETLYKEYNDAYSTFEYNDFSVINSFDEAQIGNEVLSPLFLAINSDAQKSKKKDGSNDSAMWKNLKNSLSSTVQAAQDAHDAYVNYEALKKQNADMTAIGNARMNWMKLEEAFTKSKSALLDAADVYSGRWFGFARLSSVGKQRHSIAKSVKEMLTNGSFSVSYKVTQEVGMEKTVRADELKKAQTASKEIFSKQNLQIHNQSRAAYSQIITTKGLGTLIDEDASDIDNALLRSFPNAYVFLSTNTVRPEQYAPQWKTLDNTESLGLEDFNSDQVRQSLLGNCYVVSQLTNIAEKRPDLIKKMIWKADNDHSVVRFFKKENMTEAQYYQKLEDVGTNLSDDMTETEADDLFIRKLIRKQLSTDPTVDINTAQLTYNKVSSLLNILQEDNDYKIIRTNLFAALAQTAPEQKQQLWSDYIDQYAKSKSGSELLKSIDKSSIAKQEEANIAIPRDTRVLVKVNHKSLFSKDNGSIFGSGVAWVELILKAYAIAGLNGDDVPIQNNTPLIRNFFKQYCDKKGNNKPQEELEKEFKKEFPLLSYESGNTNNSLYHMTGTAYNAIFTSKGSGFVDSLLFINNMCFDMYNDLRKLYTTVADNNNSFSDDVRSKLNDRKPKEFEMFLRAVDNTVLSELTKLSNNSYLLKIVQSHYHDDQGKLIVDHKNYTIEDLKDGILKLSNDDELLREFTTQLGNIGTNIDLANNPPEVLLKDSLIRITDHINSFYNNNKDTVLKLQHKERQTNPQTGLPEYTASAKETFESITRNVLSGKLVGAQSQQFEMNARESFVEGIVHGHAYCITDTMVDPYGFYMVKLVNPHKCNIRSTKQTIGNNGITTKHEGDSSGDLGADSFWMEYNEFAQSFSSIVL